MATKKTINQAISQANTTALAKFYRVLQPFITSHWSRATSNAVAYARFLSANQKVLKAAYKHDVLGYVGDEQQGRWCPRECNYTFAAPLKVANGSLNTLPFIYESNSHAYYLFNTQLEREQPVGQWAREWKINNGDVYSIVYVTLQRLPDAQFPAYYNFHSVDQIGVVTLRVANDIRNDRRDIKYLYFDDVFFCENTDLRHNFHFPIAQKFTLNSILDDPDWVIWRAGFGFDCVGAWCIVHSRASGKTHSSSYLNLLNQRLYGLSYIDMINEFL